MPVNPAEDINILLIVFVSLRLAGCRGFLFERWIFRVEVKNTHA